MSTVLSAFTFFQRDSVLRGLTTDLGIREASQAIFFPVVFTQGERDPFVTICFFNLMQSDFDALINRFKCLRG